VPTVSDQSSTKGPAPAAKVDLNAATEKELVGLPGVGPATAKKIMTGRPYGPVADFSKAGVLAKTIEKITPLRVRRRRQGLGSGFGANGHDPSGNLLGQDLRATLPYLSLFAVGCGTPPAHLPDSAVWVAPHGELLNPAVQHLARRVAIAYLIWPRTSPDGETVLCTFQYARSFRMGGEHRRKIASGDALSRLNQDVCSRPDPRHHPPEAGQASGTATPAGGVNFVHRKITMFPATFGWPT
jgi:hypothetical protein